MAKKQRLDTLVTELGLAPSRTRAQALILSGQVLVDDVPHDKAGAMISPESTITVRGQDMPYVSRGGLKLEGALDQLGLSVEGLACMDVGASTGGFTDCLLQRGAAKAIAIDVGYGQFAWKLRQDSRVHVMERTNVRHVTPQDLPWTPELAVIDVSFISLKIVIPVLLDLLAPYCRIIPMVKPQFEVGKGEVGKNGVVKDPEKHAMVLESMQEFFQNLGLECIGPAPSPILGPKGNKEFFFLLTRNPL
ncbi:MAG: TlyA family RNA methyltransferase [Desulfatibacillum sp.]|nr:TlyA family RNA methyltransferase [Desulfatibacillum sp.]